MHLELLLLFIEYVRMAFTDSTSWTSIDVSLFDLENCLGELS